MFGGFKKLLYLCKVLEKMRQKPLKVTIPSV